MLQKSCTDSTTACLFVVFRSLRRCRQSSTAPGFPLSVGLSTPHTEVLEYIEHEIHHDTRGNRIGWFEKTSGTLQIARPYEYHYTVLIVLLLYCCSVLLRVWVAYALKSGIGTLTSEIEVITARSK